MQPSAMLVTRCPTEGSPGATITLLPYRRRSASSRALRRDIRRNRSWRAQQLLRIFSQPHISTLFQIIRFMWVFFLIILGLCVVNENLSFQCDYSRPWIRTEWKKKSLFSKIGVLMIIIIMLAGRRNAEFVFHFIILH